MSTLEHEKPWTIREKVGIIILIIIFKIVKPTQFSSDYFDEVKKIRSLLDL